MLRRNRIVRRCAAIGWGLLGLLTLSGFGPQPGFRPTGPGGSRPMRRTPVVVRPVQPPSNPFVITPSVMPAPTQPVEQCKSGAGFKNRTQAAIEALLASDASLRAGDSAAAKSRLQGLEASIKELQSVAACYARRADQRQSACAASLKAHEVTYAQLGVQESALKQKLVQHRAALPEAEKNSAAAGQELVTIQKQAADLQREIDTPPVIPTGHGAMLIIRQLEEKKAKVAKLKEREKELRQKQAEVDTQKRFITDTEQAIRKTEAEREQLDKRKKNEHQLLGRLKVTITFLESARRFWEGASRVIGSDLARAGRDLEALIKMLDAAPATASAPGTEAERVLLIDTLTDVKLKDSLIRFGERIDEGKGLLTPEQEALCGAR